MPWRPKITPAVGGAAKAKAKAAKAKDCPLRQEFEDKQERWRSRIAAKGTEGMPEMRAEIASRWQQWSIDNPCTLTAMVETLKADKSHKQRGNVWFNKGDNPRQATHP